jgi:hypothetical protein
MMKALSQLDRYLRQGGDPSIVPVLRIAYGCLVIIHMLTLWPNAEMWFTDDGVLSTQTAQALRQIATTGPFCFGFQVPPRL